MMKKKKHLTSEEEALNEWLTRNNWLIWLAILAISIALVSLIGLFVF